MDNSQSSRNKLFQYRIGGQSKPFIDKDLQLQLPGSDSSSHQITSLCHPVYSHYSNFYASISPINSKTTEMEICRAMQEAEQSYLAWTKMKEQTEQLFSLLSTKGSQ